MNERHAHLKISFALLILISALQAAWAAPPEMNGAVFSLEAESISPYPVEPGEDFSVQVRLYNNGGELAKNVTVIPLYNEVFRFSGKGMNYEKPFSLCVDCSRENLFYFTASPDAASGEYPITFRVIEDGILLDQAFTIKVAGVPDIMLEVKSLPEHITAGKSIDLHFSVRNIGTGTARDIKVTSQSQGFIMEDPNIVYIEKLDSGEESAQDAKMMVSESLESGPKSVTLKIEYRDEASVSHTSEVPIGIRLENIVRLDISSLKIVPETIKPGDRVQLSMRIENLGQGDADNIRVEVNSTSLTGLNRAYIGKLKEDEDSPAYFTLNAGAPGRSHINVKVSYTDDLGDHVLSEEIPLEVSMPASGKEVVIIAGFVLVAGITIFAVSRRRGRKEE